GPMATRSGSRTAARKSRSSVKAKRLSRQHAPEDMTLPEWQIGLRRQFGREQDFILENLGDDPLFSDFRVGNPDNGTRYRVGIRGMQAGRTRCPCGAYLTNDLGTCKHIEFVLTKLKGRRGAKRRVQQGAMFERSEPWLSGGQGRGLRLRPGTAMPRTLLAEACELFDAADGWRLPDTRFERLRAFLAK